MTVDSMRWPGYAVLAAVMLVLLAANIYYQSAHRDLPALKLLHSTELRAVERSRDAAHMHLFNCTSALVEHQKKTDVLSNASNELERLKAEIQEMKSELKSMRRREKLEFREMDVCKDETWPGRSKPHMQLPGPKRMVKVIAWQSPSVFPGRRASEMVPIPRGMKEYFARAGVDVKSGLISSEHLGTAQYKSICDGLAVKHTNFSEFYESDIIYLDNPIAGGATSRFSDDMLPPRLPHHLWVLRFAGEALSYYPAMGDPYMLSKFNYTIGYHRGIYHMHAAPYIDLNMTRIMLNPLNDPFLPKNQSASVVMFISNCMSRNRRSEYVQELMELIPIHSYGRCLTNKGIPNHIAKKHGATGGSVGDWHGVKMDVIRQYKFLIAFENSDCYDYVTEKVFDGLNAGAIPIYMGASNIRDYVPDHSVIHANDFASPARLVEYIKLVDSTPALFASYWAWRKQPLPSRIERIKANKKNNVCNFVQQLQWT